MTKPTPTNLSASIHARLMNRAQAVGRPFNDILQYFAMERFLGRLARSPHKTKFTLKGGLMMAVWRMPEVRPTLDIDLLGSTGNTHGNIKVIFEEVCRTAPAEPDGLEFNADSVTVEDIADEAEYQGTRVRVSGNLGNARIHLQVDIGFGDAIVPGAVPGELPPSIGLTPTVLPAYSPESLIAEKTETMFRRQELNSRMKDFFDIWLLSRRHSFDGAILGQALHETFTRRGTFFQAHPTALTPAFGAAKDKQTQWSAFLRKSHLGTVAPAAFPDVVAELSLFLSPLLAELSENRPFRL
ncbi:MAG: nucleotidyl transferase AbiEii/AbiGii toxin family protein [Lentisphaeria bacterium]